MGMTAVGRAIAYAALLGLVAACGSSTSPVDLADTATTTDTTAELRGPPFALHVLTPRPALWDGPVPSADLTPAEVAARLPNPDANALIDQLRALVADAHGFAQTAAIFLPAGDAVDPATLPTLAHSVADDAAVYLLDLETGKKHPVDVAFQVDGGPLGAPNLLTLLPLQGAPLRPGARYAAVVTDRLHYTSGLAPASALGEIRAQAATLPVDAHAPPCGAAPTSDVYARVFRDHAAVLDRPDVVAFTTFCTDDRATEMTAYLDHARTQHPVVILPESPTLTDTFDQFCVFRTSLTVPVYQQGQPPYSATGGKWGGTGQAPVFDHNETARIWFTVPRALMPTAGFPTVFFIGTGAGGERGLVDRGVCSTPGFGVADVPGTGPAMEFARMGWAGVQIDGTLEGIRNTTGGNEDFLLFNVFNPAALRDNIRQSALEIALLPDALAAYTFDTSACPGAPPAFHLHPQQIALMGHSMGSSIAPLVLAAQPKFTAAILSGAGGSFIDNVMDKLMPVPVKDAAEGLLGYQAHGRLLSRFDVGLSLFQWAAELADSPPYGALQDAHILMLQGVVDHYILPSIAQATSLSMGLDLGGGDLAALSTELEAMGQPHLSPLLPLVGSQTRAFPVAGNRGTQTRVVVQNPGDAIEDGHEVNFQTARPKSQYRCFLGDLAAGRVPVVRGEAGGDACW